MEHYGTAPNHNISMVDDPALRVALAGIWDCVDTVIETGTYHGTGSTRILAESILASARKEITFHTIEAHMENHRLALKNLERFNFVQCHHGSSVSLQIAKQFMETDPALQNHHQYPGVYVDDLSPGPALAAWYLEEVGGQGRVVDQDLLAKFIGLYQESRLLIVLDSAGGIGWLEFRNVIEAMMHKQFYLLLDDTHHLKHFRSLAWIKTHSDQFEVLAEGEGWCLARCQPRVPVDG